MRSSQECRDVKSENYWLMHGDCLERMKEIPDRSVDLVLTDPFSECNIVSGVQ